MAKLIPTAIKYFNSTTLIGSGLPPAYSSAYTDTLNITDGSPQDTTTYEQSTNNFSIVFYFKFPAGSFLANKNIGFTVTNVYAGGAGGVAGIAPIDGTSGWSSAYLWGSPDGVTWGGNQYPCTSNSTGSVFLNGTVLVNNGSAGVSELSNVGNYQYLALVVNSTNGIDGVQVSDVRIFSPGTGTYIGAQNFQLSKNGPGVAPFSLPQSFLTNESAGSGTALYQNDILVASVASPPVNGIVINSNDANGYPTIISANNSAISNTNYNLVVSKTAGISQTSWFDVLGTGSSNLTIQATTTGIVSQSKTIYKQITASTQTFPNISFPKNYSKSVRASVSSNVSQFKRITKQISSVSNTNANVAQPSNLTKKTRKRTFVTIM